jgi:uncharacterized protein
VSQLSAGFVRSPHDVVAVGGQVRVWVASIDKDRRRVALTMIAPGTEKERPPQRERSPRRRPQPQKVPVAAAAGEGQAAPPRERTQRPRSERPRTERPKRRDDRDRRPPQRTGAYEKRAAKALKPITKEMEEGKEYLRSFGDLLQFHKKKQEPKADDAPTTNDQPNS